MTPLRQRMISDMQLRGLSEATQRAYVRAVRQLQPLEGFDESFLPGGVEAANEAEYRQSGVPVGPEHRQRLEALASELGIAPPW